MPQIPKSKLPTINLTTEIIGNKLRSRRKDLGLTQIELAKKIGISQVLVSKYEKGLLSLSADMLYRFAITLRISTDVLLGLRDQDLQIKLPNKKILNRLEKLDRLPLSQQRAILKTLDLALSAMDDAQANPNQ